MDDARADYVYPETPDDVLDGGEVGVLFLDDLFDGGTKTYKFFLLYLTKIVIDIL